MIPAFFLSGLPMLAACQNPASGTFVGNPTLTARIAEPPDVPVLDALLVAPVVALTGCDGADDLSLEGRAFRFVGATSDDALQIPAGAHCGVSLSVETLAIRLDGGEPTATTIVARGFELSVPGAIRARGDSVLTLRLGDASWLEAVVAAAEPGENEVDGDPALAEAFFSGLDGSALEDADAPEPPTTLPEDLPGRVDLDTWPESPLGTPTRQAGCGPGVNYDLAVPIPPAAMAARGLAAGAVGWCEANVTFADDLTPLTSAQLDWRSGDLYDVTYNGWSQGCGALHCGRILSDAGDVLDGGCTALALCAGGEAVVTGFLW